MTPPGCAIATKHNCNLPSAPPATTPSKTSRPKLQDTKKLDVWASGYAPEPFNNNNNNNRGQANLWLNNMTSVQDYLRNLRAARKEFVSKATSEAPENSASPAAAAPSAPVSSPWLKAAPAAQPRTSTVGGHSALGQGEPAPATRKDTGWATSTPVKPAAARGQSALATGADTDSDTDISHLIDQLSLKSSQKPPPAPQSTSAGAAPAPRRGSKMDMLRRKFSASSPTKSWTDLGSSGGAASLGRARTRSRSSVSILDQKIILSGISGDEDSNSSSEDTSTHSAIRTESAPRARGPAQSDGEVSERLEASVAESAIPTVPSASSVQTETRPTAESVETESVATERPSEASVPTEDSPGEVASAESESTLRSVSRASVKSAKQSAARRSAESESDSGSQSESESDSESESSVAGLEEKPAMENSKSTPKAAVAESGRSRESGNEWNSSPTPIQSHRKPRKPDSARSDRPSARRHQSKQRDRSDRTTKRSEKSHGASARQRPSPDDRPKATKENRARRDKRSSRDKDRSTNKTFKLRDDHLSERGSRSRRHPKSSAALATGADFGDPNTPPRRRRHRADRERDRERERERAMEREWRRDRERGRDSRRPEQDVEWTEDASESLVVSYQRRVARSSAGCCHCRRTAWPPPPPPPPPVTVVVPPAAPLAGGGGIDASRLGTTASAAFVAAGDEDAALSAILTQQIVLTRHFLATQRRLHEMYTRALRETQRYTYTHRDDLKVGRRLREERRRGARVD